MIDLRGIVGGAVDVAFDIAGQIVDAGVYHKPTPVAYDPSVGTSSNTEALTNVGVLFGKFKQSEVDGQNIQFGDRKIIIKVSEMATEPQRQDYFISSNGTRYDLFLIQKEPTDSVWILAGREHRQ